SGFDLTRFDAGPRGFAGGAFDGRRVYFVPYATAPGVTSGLLAQYDVNGAFEDGGGFTVFDMAALDAGCKGFQGAVFDGRYLYFIPSAASVVARFDAREPRSPPPSGGSFY